MFKLRNIIVVLLVAIVVDLCIISFIAGKHSVNPVKITLHPYEIYRNCH